MRKLDRTWKDPAFSRAVNAAKSGIGPTEGRGLPGTSSFSAACSSRAAILAKRRFGAAEADYQTHPNVFKAFNKIYHFY
jgi:hypothetical protein